MGCFRSQKGPSEDSQSRRRPLENHEKSLEIHGFSEFGSRRASRGLLRYYESSDSLRSFQALLDSTHLVDGRALLLGVGVVLVSVDHGAVLLPVVQAGVESRYKHVDGLYRRGAPGGVGLHEAGEGDRVAVVGAHQLGRHPDHRGD